VTQGHNVTTPRGKPSDERYDLWRAVDQEDNVLDI
jgi:hypothetical protein